ncbi:MAG: hypothetical protein ABH868_02040 [bacterium]
MKKIIGFIGILFIFMVLFFVFAEAKDIEVQGITLVNWYHKQYDWGNGYSDYGYFRAVEGFGVPPEGGRGKQAVDQLPSTKVNYVGVQVAWGMDDNNDLVIEPWYWDDPPQGTRKEGLTPDIDEVKQLIDYLHTDPPNGIGVTNVMIFPQVRVGWEVNWAATIGTFYNAGNQSRTWTDAQMDTWFTNYKNFLRYYAQQLFNNLEAGDIFSIGCELRSMTGPIPRATIPDTYDFEAKWDDIITTLKGDLPAGVKLMYNSNWDEFENVVFWDNPDLDYASVDAYFPLSGPQNFNPATVAAIEALWSANATGIRTQPPFDPYHWYWYDAVNTDGYSCISQDWLTKLDTWATSYDPDLKVVFGEFGYPSKHYATYEPWQGWSSTSENLVGGNQAGNYNGPLQSMAFEAAMRVFKDRSWFKGMFVWHWSLWPEAGHLAGLTQNINYTPQSDPMDLTGRKPVLDTIEIGYNDQPDAPVVNGPVTVPLGEVRTYNFQADDGDFIDPDEKVKYFIDWGDGSTEETVWGDPNWIKNATHTWTSLGNLTITVEAYDNSGNGPYNRTVSTDFNENDTSVVTTKDIMVIEPAIYGQRMEYQNDTFYPPGTPSWAFTWKDLDDGRSIRNDEEVKLFARLSDKADYELRFYYTTDGTDPVTWLDTSPSTTTCTDVGTSFYIVPTSTTTVIAGVPFDEREFETIVPPELASASSTFIWKPFAKGDFAGNVFYSTGTPVSVAYDGGPGGTVGVPYNEPAGNPPGDRDYNVMFSYGQFIPNADPYPLEWDGVNFSTATTSNYVSLRHSPNERLSLTTASTPYMYNNYYFMPAQITPPVDTFMLDASHFAVPGSDGLSDLLYGEEPTIYVRTADTDVVSGLSTIDYSYNVWSSSRAVVLGPRTVVTESINADKATYTEAEKHQGYHLKHQFLQPTVYGGAGTQGLKDLPQGTTVQYYFNLRDEDGSGLGGNDRNWWQFKLFADGVRKKGFWSKPGSPDLATAFNMVVLQDDYTRPHCSSEPQKLGGDTQEHSFSQPYYVTIGLEDTPVASQSVYANMPMALSPESGLTFGNVIPGRGAASGINTGISSEPWVVGSSTSPVHGTALYYKFVDQATFATVIGIDLANGDYYGDSNTDTGWNFVRAKECGDATDNYDGKLALTAGAGGYSAVIPLDAANPFITSPVRSYLFYRVYATNYDKDPQGYDAPSYNHYDQMAGSVVVGGKGKINVNEHGPNNGVGTAYSSPYWENMSTPNGRSAWSDMDHGWVMPTKSAGKIISPPMVKITSEVTIQGVSRKVITYIDGVSDSQGKIIGDVLFTEIK